LGTQPPEFTFGSLYRLERWARGRHTAVCRPSAISAEDSLQQLFDEAATTIP
jgi:N-acetylglucosamine malate deacetylase 1